MSESTRSTRLILVSFSLLAGACGGGDVSAPALAPPTQSIDPAPTSFTEPVLAPRGGRAATGLVARPECDGGSEAVTHLSWSPARELGTAQKVAVTPYADGFATNRFTVSPRLGSRVGRYDWRETTANASYRWRILTRHNGWTGSKISSFIAPSCGVEDYG